jgi:hypothetical protein
MLPTLPTGGAEPRPLTARKHPGRRPALAPRQQLQVRRWINGKDPRQYAFDFGEEAVIVGESTQRTAFGDDPAGARTEQQGTDVAQFARMPRPPLPQRRSPPASVHSRQPLLTGSLAGRVEIEHVRPRRHRWRRGRRWC